MKSLIALVAVSALAAMSTPSLAAQFSPPDTAFTLTGSMDVDQSQTAEGFSCPFTFRGRVTPNGRMKIRSASFCPRVQASGLPWIWKAVQARHPAVGVALITIVIDGFDCGLDQNQVIVRDGGFTLGGNFTANGCVIGGGSGESTPTITIVR